MTAAAIIALAIALGGAVVAIVKLALTVRSDAQKHASDARKHAGELAVERDKVREQTTRAERAEFERDATKQRLADVERTVDALAKELENAANPNGDLPPGDVVTRLVRQAAKQARAARGGSVPPSAEAEAVHPRAAADGGTAAEVLPAGPLDPNESLL